jgi:hypothetical protein
VSSKAAALRVVLFRPTGAEASVDASLRESILPALCSRPGIADAWVARHGEATADRILVAVWASPPTAADEVATIMRFMPPESVLVSTRHDLLPIEVAARFDRVDRPAVLRLFRGIVQPGQLAAYIEEARSGMLADAAVNAGLHAFYLARAGGDEFVTVSLWSDWDAIERATGGNVRDPFATRNSDRLATFQVDHFEVVPDTPRPEALEGEDSALLAS